MDAVSESKLLLNPLDRAAEILFGLIMALTFTCSIGIATKGEAQIRELLVAAIGCNMAWGVVDAIMYLIGELARRSREKKIFDSVQKSSDTDEVRKYIAEALSSDIASAIGEQEIGQIKNKLINLPVSKDRARLTAHDVKHAIALFFVVFVSTFPVVVPFLFIRDTKLALRISNLVAIVMMFLCGWSVARYVGANKWVMSIVLTVIGVLLVGVTVALGG